MCGGAFGKVLSTVTDAVGLTNTKDASQGFDAQAADVAAKKEAQATQNAEIAARKKRKASDVLSSTEDSQKQATLGG